MGTTVLRRGKVGRAWDILRQSAVYQVFNRYDRTGSSGYYRAKKIDTTAADAATSGQSYHQTMIPCKFYEQS